MKNTLNKLLQANPLGQKDLKTFKLLIFIHLVTIHNNIL